MILVTAIEILTFHLLRLTMPLVVIDWFIDKLIDWLIRDMIYGLLDWIGLRKPEQFVLGEIRLDSEIIDLKEHLQNGSKVGEKL